MKYIYLILFLTFLFVISCTFQMKERSNSENNSASGENVSVESQGINSSDTFGPGDILHIKVYEADELTGNYQVGPRGHVVFPFIGKIDVRNMSNFELAAYIEEKLKEGYFRNPQVVVFLEEYVSKMVYILGQVKKPRQMEIKKQTSVLEAVAVAGGFTKLADRSNVIVRRMDVGGKELKFVLNVDKMIDGKETIFILHPGDVVFVKERFF